MDSLAMAVAHAREPEEAALAVASDEYPALDAQNFRHSLDVYGAEFAPRVAALGSLERARQLCRYLHGELGFRGCENYDDPRSNYLNEVLDRRTGSPVALAVVLMAIGKRAGVDVRGVAFPGHFLVRIEGHYADPYEGGAPLDRNRLLNLANESMSDPRRAQACLDPVGVRTVAVRLLLNLQRIYRRRADHARAFVVSDRLYELTRAPSHRVDRGVHALALGATRAAILDFEAYLAMNPDGDIANRAREQLKRARLLAPPLIN